MNLPKRRIGSSSLASSWKLRKALIGVLPAPLVQHWQQFSEPLRQRWRALAPRERRGLRWALWCVAFGMLVTIGFMPAWRTMQQAPAQLNILEGQLQQMNKLASEARLIRSTPVVSMAQSIDALKAASDRLGVVARLDLQGQQATVTFNGVSPEAFVEWLRETRTVGRARITEAQLTRTGTTYSGSVLLVLGGVTP